jgi:hemoglobin
MSGTDGDGTPTLIRWAGGPPVITPLIDELLSPFFPGGVSAEHRRHVSVWWTEVLGGPSGHTDQRTYPPQLPAS